MRWCAERDSNPRPTVCKRDVREGSGVLGEGVSGALGALGEGGDPNGVLWYCVWNRGYREWLAAPPAGHRSSLRDGGLWGDKRRDAASSVLAVHWGHRRDVCASVLAVYFAEHRRLEQCPNFILDWRDGLLHEARVVVLVMIITRRLNPGEGRLYRAVRLEALRESPGTFLSRYEDAVGRSDESWAEQADGGAAGSDRATFVSLGERPVGGGLALS
jgi:hypothetical protein